MGRHTTVQESQTWEQRGGASSSPPSCRCWPSLAPRSGYVHAIENPLGHCYVTTNAATATAPAAAAAATAAATAATATATATPHAPLMAPVLVPWASPAQGWRAARCGVAGASLHCIPVR